MDGGGGVRASPSELFRSWKRLSRLRLADAGCLTAYGLATSK